MTIRTLEQFTEFLERSNFSIEEYCSSKIGDWDYEAKSFVELGFDALDIIEMIGESTTIIYKDKPIEVVKQPINVPNSPLKPMDKKQEMVESLEYLKSKPTKSKQDKESISMLEAILKNMK